MPIDGSSANDSSATKDESATKANANARKQLARLIGCLLARSWMSQRHTADATEKPPEVSSS
jgi:hypothetical protein